MANNTKDVKMSYIESDVDKIQVKTNLYLKNYGAEGAMHLALEVAQNSIDECCDKNSPGKEINMVFDESTGILAVEDDGRGFPEVDYPMDIFCTKIQSGSKFYRDQGGSSAGEFGLGLTAVNALSDIFVLESRRETEGYVHTIKFELGKKVSDDKRPLKKSEKQHGTRVLFKPSPKFLGKGTIFPYDKFKSWCEFITYLIPTNNKIKMTLTKMKGLEVSEKNKFKPRPFNEILSSFNTDSVKVNGPSGYLEGHTTWTEEVEDVATLIKSGKSKLHKVKRELTIKVAFGYSNTEDCIYNSFCNYANTTNGGVHEKAFEEIFCGFLMGRTNAALTDKQKETLGIKWDDIRTGLCAAINLETNAEVGFVGNAKDAVGNNDLKPIIKDIIRDELKKLLDGNKTLAADLIKVIKLNAKARNEASKARQASVSERMNNFKEHKSKKYIPCNNDKRGQYRELFLVEGDSASGSVNNARNPDTQAVFLFRGVTANPVKVSLATLMENEEWRRVRDILRCGIGPTCDVSKLWFDRINIFTDSDVDGSYITAEILAFFYMHMRPIIEAGKLYKVVAPLYELNDKKHHFVVSKREMVELFRKKIAKQYKVKTEAVKEYFNADQMQEFLMDTYSYLSNLNKCAGLLGGISPLLVERVAAIFTMWFVTKHDKIPTAKDSDKIYHQLNDQKFVTMLMRHIQSAFPEVILDDYNNIRGAVNGRYVTMALNSRCIQYMASIMPVYAKYGYLLEVKDKNDDVKAMTIKQFLDEADKFNADILTRYKGLGECDAKDLRATSMLPDNRTSIQYTIDDVEKELEILNMLHNNSKADVEKRKEFISNSRIDLEDFDN